MIRGSDPESPLAEHRATYTGMGQQATPSMERSSGGGTAPLSVGGRRPCENLVRPMSLYTHV